MNNALESLFVLASTHHDASLSVREAIALTAEQVSALQQTLHALPVIQECMVVNTCNRLEVYGLADTPEVEESVRNCICEYNGVSRDLFAVTCVASTDMLAGGLQAWVW